MKWSRLVGLGALLVMTASNAFAQNAEAVYAEARRALNRLEFGQAIDGFEALRRDYPDSRYEDDSYYWEAFALERSGNLAGAVELIDTLLREYPDSATLDDARELKVRACMELARRGDRACAEEIESAIRGAGEVDEAMKLQAVNALIYLPAERAVPIAAKVVANPNQPLAVRQQALFILGDMAAEPVVLEQVREALKAVALDTTNETELRGQAVFWLSETPGRETVAFLEELIRSSSTDPELQQQAVFAISQHEPAQSLPLLESVVLNEAYDLDIRVQALHWIGERGGAEALPFLTRAYAELSDEELKQQALYAVSQTDAAGATPWLVARAGDAAEPLELRQQALFFAAEGGLPAADLKAIYERTAEPELREYVVWLIAERGGPESLDAILAIARTDPDPAMRERAIALIGTSEDPRAEEFLLEILGEN